MQLFGRALVASAVVLAACAGGESSTGDSTAVVASNAGVVPTPAATQAAEPAAAVTGQTHEVQMVLDNGQYKYVPDKITAKEGDAIKFINVSGFPHNVSFKTDQIPDDVEGTLAQNMPANAYGMAKMGPIVGPLLTQANQTYTISLAGMKAGEYPFVCTPHEAMGMKGTITIQ